MSDDNKRLYISDTPDKEEDAFKIHTHIADTLLNITSQHDVSKHAFTIGLFGEWGSGKSFIVHKLEQKIAENNDSITFFNIDVWKYAGHPLLRSILFSLDRQFQELATKNPEKYAHFKDEYRNADLKSLKEMLYADEALESIVQLNREQYKKELKDTIQHHKFAYILLLGLIFLFALIGLYPDFWESSPMKALSKFIEPFGQVFAFLGVSGLLAFLFQRPIEELLEVLMSGNVRKNFIERANFSPEQFEATFVDMLSHIPNERYVIVLDNLDRCEPHVAYQTLSTIKTFMDVKNCFYIIPVDDEAIQHHLASIEVHTPDNFHRKFSDEFMDKIFQTYIKIPILKEVERDKYIRQLLEQLDFNPELDKSDIETITQILYFAYKGERPRNIIRFLNDYSSYYQLALKAIPESLHNITLFTIMVAIKQKWHQFEKELIHNPTFFMDYPDSVPMVNAHIKNREQLTRFLSSISPLLTPRVKEDSLFPFIYFKPSEAAIIIAKALKNGLPGAFTLNRESSKILLRAFGKNIQTPDHNLPNNFYVLACLIKKYHNAPFINDIILKYWIGFASIAENYIETIIDKIAQDKKLDFLLNTLTNEKITHYRTTIEERFSSYFLKKLELVETAPTDDLLPDILSGVLSSSYTFTPSTITKLFENWHIEHHVLNRLLQVISEHRKAPYLPKTVFQQLLEMPANTDTLALFKHWEAQNIPKVYISIVYERFVKTLQQIDFENINQQLFIEVEFAYELLTLLKPQNIEKKQIKEFTAVQTNTLKGLFEFTKNHPDLQKLSIRFFIETAYFQSINRKVFDQKLTELFTHIGSKNLPMFLEIIEEKNQSRNYWQQLLKLEQLKANLFKYAPNDLEVVIFKQLSQAKLYDLDLIFPTPIETQNIVNFQGIINDKNIPIYKKGFAQFLLKSILEELPSDAVYKKLIYLHSNFELEPHFNTLIEHKSSIIAYYKHKPKLGIEILNVIRKILPYKSFHRRFLNEILNYINTLKGNSKQLHKFKNIHVLVESFEGWSADNLQTLKLLDIQ